jgi:hypothetical protein
LLESVWSNTDQLEPSASMSLPPLLATGTSPTVTGSQKHRQPLGKEIITQIKPIVKFFIEKQSFPLKKMRNHAKIGQIF